MIRRLAAFLAVFAMGSADAQAAPRTYPSLARRPVESSDRLATPQTPAVAPAATDLALANNVATLQDQAVSANTAFQSELARSRDSVKAAAGSQPMSEDWVVAQMSISAADAVRYDSVAALAGLDTLSVERQDNVDAARVAADMATINPARTRVLAIVDAQNDALDGLKASLTNP